MPYSLVGLRPTNPAHPFAVLALAGALLLTIAGCSDSSSDSSAAIDKAMKNSSPEAGLTVLDGNLLQYVSSRSDDGDRTLVSASRVAAVESEESNRGHRVTVTLEGLGVHAEACYAHSKTVSSGLVSGSQRCTRSNTTSKRLPLFAGSNAKTPLKKMVMTLN